MLTKDTFFAIEDTIEQMMEENDGIISLIPNLDKIAKRAKVSIETVKEYLSVLLFEEQA
jgi:hypothetical protein